MKKFIVILLTIFLFCNTQVFAKRKKSSRHRRAGGKYTKLKSNGFNINSETVGMDLNLNKIKPQNSVEQNISMICGVPADINNNLAKRKCALVIAEGLKRFCTSFYGGESGYNDCSSKIKVQFKFNMGLPQLEGIKETIGDKECKGEELQKFCSNFEEELINGLWDIFSKPVIRKRKYCNFSKAKFYAAQECFRYIQSEKNSFAAVNGNGLTDAFTRSRKTKLDEGIEQRCGLDAIKKAYENIAVDKFEDGDVSEFINTNKANFEKLKLKGVTLEKNEEKGIKKMKDHFTSDVAKIFANLGDNSYNIMGQVGKFIELKLATKSSSYPRELVTIANTFIVEGENACGQSFKTAMADTSFKLSDNRSALEKYIAEKGIIKGTYDYLIDNTVGVFAGTDKADEIKKRGWKLPPKEFDPGDSNEQIDGIIAKLNGLIKTCPHPDNPDDPDNLERKKESITNFTENIKQYIQNINDAYKQFKEKAGKFKPRKDGKKDFENIQLAFYKKVVEALNILNGDGINKFKRDNNGFKIHKVNDILKDLHKKTIEDLTKYIKSSVDELNKVDYFTCPQITEGDMDKIFKDPPKQILFTLGNKLEKRKKLENYIEAFRNAIITFKNACTDDSKCPNNPLVSINLDELEPPK